MVGDIDYTKELVDKAIHDEDLYKKFKSLANRELSENDITLSVEKTGKGSKIEFKENVYNEKIIQLDLMKKTFGMATKTEPKVKFIRGIDGSSFRNIKINFTNKE